jgi:hypothetical protein
LRFTLASFTRDALIERQSDRLPLGLENGALTVALPHLRLDLLHLRGDPAVTDVLDAKLWHLGPALALDLVNFGKLGRDVGQPHTPGIYLGHCHGGLLLVVAAPCGKVGVGGIARRLVVIAARRERLLVVGALPTTFELGATFDLFGACDLGAT